MLIGIGFAIVLACVFGAFAVFGGNIGIILHALPHEFITIGGGAIGAFVVANSSLVLKKTGKGMKQAFKGEKWKTKHYQDLLSLMFMLVRELRSNGPLGLERHVESPQDSTIFRRFPAIIEDKDLVNFIADYLRMMSLDLNNPYQLDAVIEADIEKLHHEHMKPQMALQAMADGLPAIGIVAAVLGVINTMGSIDQPTEILGAMIGSALVGTFLGVLLSYCVVGPLAARLGQIIDEDAKVYEVIRAVLVAHLQGLAPLTAIEVGRRAIPTSIAPTFAQLETATEDLPRDLKLAAAA